MFQVKSSQIIPGQALFWGYSHGYSQKVHSETRTTTRLAIRDAFGSKNVVQSLSRIFVHIGNPVTAVWSSPYSWSNRLIRNPYIQSQQSAQNLADAQYRLPRLVVRQMEEHKVHSLMHRPVRDDQVSQTAWTAQQNCVCSWRLCSLHTLPRKQPLRCLAHIHAGKLQDGIEFTQGISILVCFYLHMFCMYFL